MESSAPLAAHLPLLLLPLLLLAAPAAARDPEMYLNMLEEDRAQRHNAYCLDGTLPGFYYGPAATESKNTSWIVHLEGGGYCRNVTECLDRTNEDSGSSKNWPYLWDMAGGMSTDLSVNPAFADFHHIFIPYCDGFFYAGDRPGSLKTQGKELFFRGRPILKAVLDQIDDIGLAKADEIVLTGCSAGSLAAYLHGDYIGSRYPNAKYGVAPVSGFFPELPSVTGSMDVWDTIEKAATELFQIDLSGGGCMDATNDSVYCVIPNNSYAYMNSPIFAINSAIDLYALENIWDGDTDCTDSLVRDCSPEAIADINGWGTRFWDSITNSGDTFYKTGNGAFIHSCYEHCNAAEQDESFTNLAINGVTMSAAVQKWWDSDFKDSADGNTYMPCYLVDTPPHYCNPTCKYVDPTSELKTLLNRNETL
mmetsp:Transcript_15068/g.36909  ORF Transcript_15068/g.36909 Transcript_15068/m.36909 type:complete len:421 (+) Transcript_15068:27-1289(+)